MTASAAEVEAAQKAMREHEWWDFRCMCGANFGSLEEGWQHQAQVVADAVVAAAQPRIAAVLAENDRQRKLLSEVCVALHIEDVRHAKFAKNVIEQLRADIAWQQGRAERAESLGERWVSQSALDDDDWAEVEIEAGRELPQRCTAARAGAAPEHPPAADEIEAQS